jgi:hypothetical protein
MASFSDADPSRAGSRGVRPFSWRGALLTVVLGAGTAPAAARAQPPEGPACSYDACALRREGVVLSQRVLAGAEGRVVARAGFSGFRLESAMAGSPRALTELRIHRREARRGSLLTLVGGVVTAVRIVQAAGDDGRRNSTETAAIVAGGAVVSLVGGWRMQIADRALNRAVWWHNRDLTR